MRKLGTFCVSFSIAIFLSQYLFKNQYLFPLALVCGAAALFVSFIRNKRRLRMLLICVGLGIGFFWNWGYHTLFFLPTQDWDGTTTTCYATVRSFPENTKYGIKVEIAIENDSKNIPTMLYADEMYQDLKPGDQIELMANFASSQRIENENVTYYTAKGIFLLAYQEGEIRVISRDTPAFFDWPVFAAQELKKEISVLYSQEQSQLMQALLTGDRSDFSDSLETSLSRTGLTHIVAVSGMHLSFLTGLVFLWPGKPKKKLMITIPILLFFMAATGNSPSVVRAGIMQILWLLAPCCHREVDPPTSLSVALAVLLAINPFSAANVGLQLSFASIAGIYLVTERVDLSLQMIFIRKRWKQKKRFTAWIRSFCAVIASSVGALIFTIPLSAYYFGLVSLISLLANVLVLWAVSLVFIGGLLSGVIGILFYPIGKGLAIVVSPLLQYILTIVKALGNLPFSALSTVHIYSRLWLVFSYILLLLFLFWPIFKERRQEKVKNRPIVPVSLCVASFCIAMLLNYFTYNRSQLTLSVLDVGQGQCIVLLSSGKAVIVDCGGSSSDNAGNVAADYLQGMGIQTIECLVLSHCHEDHANGVVQLMERMQVLRVAMPDSEEEDDLHMEVLKCVAEEGSTLYTINETTNILFGQANMTLYPPFEGEDENERGLTILCNVRSFDLLITGDMGEETEERLVSNVELPDVEVLVVGHHGSKYSTSDLLLDDITPEIAVISVGKNSYGHPAPETLERLSGRKIKWYRTDEMGTITIQSQ